MGRPKKVIDWDHLDNLLTLGAGLIDCSELLKMSDDTIQKNIKEKHNCTFTEYREKKLANMRVKLLKKQFDVAMNGNVTMLIWLGKQRLGQSEKTETTNRNVEMSYEAYVDEVRKKNAARKKKGGK